MSLPILKIPCKNRQDTKDYIFQPPAGFRFLSALSILKKISGYLYPGYYEKGSFRVLWSSGNISFISTANLCHGWNF